MSTGRYQKLRYTKKHTHTHTHIYIFIHIYIYIYIYVKHTWSDDDISKKQRYQRLIILCQLYTYICSIQYTRMCSINDIEYSLSINIPHNIINYIYIYGHLPPITCWCFYTPHTAAQKQDDQHERSKIYIHMYMYMMMMMICISKVKLATRGEGDPKAPFS